jgi:hypothetical protein
MGPPRFSAKFDERSRTAKAQKIAMLSGIVRPAPGATMLYFGSGLITLQPISQAGVRQSGTFAVGFVDAERMSSGINSPRCSGRNSRFQTGASTSLYPTMSSSILRGREQHTHLAEIGRCLRDNGKLYIAVPNRWGLIDAHYRLPFLGGCRGSWPMAICD